LLILGITDITRKENFLYYRREFVGNAHYGMPDKERFGKIEFTIETTPLGTKNVQVSLVDSVDYPVLPVVQGLKKFILGLDSEGLLP
jgi:hypothetical protein